ncbi:hypothetical protein [Streptomyces sp. TS71-3]|uniref:hypothetical protein n=1 Tax=Streptomyces sp. TS71-3 TaxID=2733862 RepID=UPI001B027E4F|nr:hypothetical protein [Streptomyces sp. TS71-3]GHJ39952.1 hypothetical protein Sm713_55610 [Streptomyces sp. TS71-3]
MTNKAGADVFLEGDTAYDIRNKRNGIITHQPQPGTWICLADPDHPGDLERHWHTRYGDLRHSESGLGGS